MRVVVLICGLIGLCAGPVFAKTYTVDWTFGAQSVSGTIETDGRLGEHDFISTIENWASVDITLTSPGLFGGGPSSINETNLLQFVFRGLTLTETAITFDFDGSGVFIAQNSVATGITAPLAQSAWCMAGLQAPNQCTGSQPRGGSGFVEFNGTGLEITSLFASSSGEQVIATSSATSGGGGSTVVPVPAGLPLVLSGIAGLALLRRRKAKT